MRSLSFTVFTFLLFPFIAKAQYSDCIDAEVICSNVSIAFNPSGPGANDFLPAGSNSGCLVTGEHQSAWYYFQFQSDMPPNGRIEFTITPDAGAGQDYDFAVFGPNVSCAALGSPIRCSYAANGCEFCPQTGLGMGTTDFSESPTGDGFVAALEVQPGQGFYLLIDNFSNNSTGFSLTWGGKAAPFLDCMAPECQIAVTATPNYSLCEGGSTQLMANVTNASGAVSYQWISSNGAEAYLTNRFIRQPFLIVPVGAPDTLNYALIVADGPCVDTAYVTVNVLKLPTPVISGVAEFCEGDSTILSLDTTYVSYQWSTGSTDSAIVMSSSGNVTVSVTNAAGCTSSASYLVVENLSALTIIEASFCENESLLFADSLITAEGMYEWQYTTTAGCDSVVQVIATFAPFEDCIPECQITVTATPNYNLCEGTSTQFMATATGVSGAESYEWIGDNGAEEYLTDRFIREPVINVPIGAPDTLRYTLATTEGACTYIVNVMVNVLRLPAPAISGAAEFCEGDSTVLILDTTYVTYQWSTGSTDSTTVVSSSGNVTVSVTNAVGCTSSASYLVVENLAALTIIEASFCENEGLLFADSLITAEGTYEWQYTTTAGCDSIVQLIATFAPFEECAPECQITVTTTPSYSLCEGTSTQLMANATGVSGTESYEWIGDNGAEEYLTDRFIREPVINVPIGAPDTLNYALVVTDGPCTDTAYVTVNVLKLPTPVISGVAEFCEGDSTVLSLDTTYVSYQWSTGSTDSTTVVSSSGNVTVSVTNAAGCTSSASYLVVENLAALTIIEASFCENESLLFADSLITAEGTYEWQYTTTAGCDSIVQLIATKLATALTEIDTTLTFGQPFDGVLYSQDTTLEFALQTVQGCDSLVRVHLQIVTSTNEPGGSLLAVHLFPNPTTGAVTLRFDQMPREPMRIYLFNELGQTVRMRKLSAEPEQRLSLDGLPAATYRAVIMAAGKVLAVEKLVIL